MTSLEVLVPLTPTERTLRARLAAHASHAATADPAVRAAKGAAGLLAKFALKVDPDGLLDPDERLRRAEHLRRAHMARLAFLSAKARRARKEGSVTAAARGPDARRGPATTPDLDPKVSRSQATNGPESIARRFAERAPTPVLAVFAVNPSDLVDVILTDEIVPSPCCQPSAIDLLLHEPAGVVNGSVIGCQLCGRRTTRWALIRRVLEDADAFDRLTQALVTS